jgi:hypothetical protein
MKLLKTISGLILFIALLFSLISSTAQADGPFSSNIQTCPAPISPITPVNPTVVTTCTQAGLQTALNNGGHITFNCGAGPFTIPLNSQLELNPDVDTMIDGGGLVTLDGQNITRILNKEWHDYDAIGPVNITIQNMRFINAKAPSGDKHSGGAIRAGYSGTSLHIIDSTFANNSTTDMNTTDNQGGAIFVHNSIETVISGSLFENNAAGSGGAFGGIATDLFIYNSQFSNNSAADNASGGIVRGYGGAIALDGVDKNFELGDNERVYVCGSQFENNSAIRGGGAIDIVVSDNYGTKTIVEKSSFFDNIVTGLNGEYGQGGAIYLVEDDRAGGSGEDNIEIFDSTFHGNEALRQGGAVWFTILGHGAVSNSTFEANTTTTSFPVGQGGAMAIGGNVVNITNSTFANNHATFQGGAIHGGSSNNQITLKNTIFLNNTLNLFATGQYDPRWQGFHTNRTMLDGGQNIQFPRLKPVYNNDVNNLITENPIFEHPLLADLADNGGPTLTMALLAGSPAINAGANGCPATDQRGESREGQCDIGAYEYKVSALDASPGSQSIFPGASASYQIEVLSSDTIVDPLTLSATNNYPDLDMSLTPTTILPGQTATLTLTDTRSGSLTPGVWHTIPITASNGDLTLTTEVTLLVGGQRVFLPAIIR